MISSEKKDIENPNKRRISNKSKIILGIAIIIIIVGFGIYKENEKREKVFYNDVAEFLEFVSENNAVLDEQANYWYNYRGPGLMEDGTIDLNVYGIFNETSELDDRFKEFYDEIWPPVGEQDEEGEEDYLWGDYHQSYDKCFHSPYTKRVFLTAYDLNMSLLGMCNDLVPMGSDPKKMYADHLENKEEFDKIYKSLKLLLMKSGMDVN